MPSNDNQRSGAVDVQAEVEVALRAAAEGLLLQLDGIDRQLAEAQQRVDALRGSRSYVISALRRINPDLVPTGKPGPKPGALRGRQQKDTAAKIARIEGWVEAHAGEFADGFVSAEVYRALRAEDPPGTPTRASVGQGLCVAVFKDLHRRGVVRVDRKGTGGAPIYKLIGGSNGTQPS